MNINFGLFPPLISSPSRASDGTRLRGPAKTLAKKRALSARALADLEEWWRSAQSGLSSNPRYRSARMTIASLPYPEQMNRP